VAEGLIIDQPRSGVVTPSEDIVEVVGNTPIVRLGRVGKGVKPRVFAKLEYLNPGGSAKDRIAAYLVREAERKGILKTGGTIIEPTSGNTGVGLAMLAAVRGYKTIFTMPDKVSEEKRSLLRAFGAELVVAPTDLPPDSKDHYINVAKRLAEETKNAYMPNQYENRGNPDAHYATTGPEIWRQMNGMISALVVGVGTGGTISGAGRFLKERNRSIRVVGVEPEGSIYSNVKFGESRPVHQYLVEGVGEDFIPKTYDETVVDEMLRVSDAESFGMARRLAKEEGMLVGGSSGMAVVGALRFGETGNEGDNIVVILPDTGRNYLSKIFDDAWLRDKGMR
jgi:cystathionine beta-synthase